MHADLSTLFIRQYGVATTAQILQFTSRRHLQMLLECTAVERIWHGVYSLGPADADRRLRGLDLASGANVAVCLGTAARAYGFDTENRAELHVLNPSGHQLRPAPGLVIHRRDGAPLSTVSGRCATAAAGRQSRLPARWPGRGLWPPSMPRCAPGTAIPSRCRAPRSPSRGAGASSRSANFFHLPTAGRSRRWRVKPGW